MPFNKISVEPVKDFDKNEIAWYNIETADKIFSLAYLCTAVTGLMSNNPELTFQDIEKEFRKRNLNTYLFAKKRELDNNMCLSIPGKKNDKTQYKYECNYGQS